LNSISFSETSSECTKLLYPFSKFRTKILPVPVCLLLRERVYVRYVSKLSFNDDNLLTSRQNGGKGAVTVIGIDGLFWISVTQIWTES
jgi:hypothetical protein